MSQAKLFNFAWTAEFDEKPPLTVRGEVVAQSAKGALLKAVRVGFQLSKGKVRGLTSAVVLIELNGAKDETESD